MDNNATTNQTNERRRGGGDDNKDDVAVLHRWRLDVGNANADGADAMAGCGYR